MTQGPAGASERPERRPARLRDRVRRPEYLTDVIQIVKAVIAGTGAWWISAAWLDSAMPFLAPWAALLTVHATVHRSLTRGIQTTATSAIGVTLSFVVGYFLGVELWTFALALFLGLTAARISWIRDEGIAVATTAVFILSSGFDDQAPLLPERVLEVTIGVVCGVLVNLLVLPPLRDGQAGRYVDSVNRRMGGVLVSMADEFADSWDTDRAEAWSEEIESIGREIDSAWAVVRFARESRRSNPRGRLSRPSSRGRRSDIEGAGYEEVLGRLDEGVSHLRHLARTLREAAYSAGSWDDRFRRRWVEIVAEVGRAVADPGAEVAPMHEELTDLSAELSESRDLPAAFWPTYGSLITSVRHIVVIVDDVGSARAARRERRTAPEATRD